MANNSLIVRYLGCQNYQTIYQRMLAFTLQRDENTLDELWLLEHFPVFTQGQNGKTEHIIHDLNPIPLIQTDRGGQITYHGPGQLIAYPLLALNRFEGGVRDLVTQLENCLVKLLQQYNITAYADSTARGVYVQQAKIASLGLRIKRSCCYHGIALNINLDLTPFTWINPCGLTNISMTSLQKLGINSDVKTVATEFTTLFCQTFAFDPIFNPTHDLKRNDWTPRTSRGAT